MNCEMITLSAIFPVHWAKKLYKMTHLSGSVRITEIHQLPHCASVIMWTLVELNYILIFSFPALRYRSAAVMRLDFLCSAKAFLAWLLKTTASVTRFCRFVQHRKMGNSVINIILDQKVVSNIEIFILWKGFDCCHATLESLGYVAKVIYFKNKPLD